MEQKLKVRITAVRHRTIRVAAGAPLLLRAQCMTCGREVEALTRRQAGEILEVRDQELGALINTGRVHAIQTMSGSIRVCKDSLFLRQGEET
jgi:hypothetical protein